MNLRDGPTASTDRLVAALADRYRVERELGAGGMATVCLARDLRHDRDVAIKGLNAELAESLGRQRFVREIKLAARLNHPHILPLYGRSYDVTKDGETFVMLREPPGRQRRRIVVTFNWVAELTEKVPR